MTVHPSAEVSEEAKIGHSSSVWQLAHIRERASIGDECVIGRGVYIGPGVSVGDRCKIQNYALLYEPAHISNGVFIGPGVVLTNDTYPRSVTPAGELKSSADWEASGVTIGEGASLGAHATCVAPVTIGEWSVVAAGAVVTANVAPHALVAGVPARQIGWVGKAGKRLESDKDLLRCPVTGETFRLTDGRLISWEHDG